MDIVLLNDYAFVNGGASQVALSSARALCWRGHSVSFFAPVGPADQELKTIPGLKVCCLGQYDLLSDPNRLRATSLGLWNFQAAQALRRMLIELDPDKTIVHVHGWTKALTSSAIHAALSRGFSVVLTLHDYFTACPNGAFFDYRRQCACELQPLSWPCLRAACDARRQAHKWWRLIRLVIQRNFGPVPAGLRDFIVISKLSHRLLAPFLPPAARVYHLADPVEAQPDEPVKVELNSHFLAVGRLAPEKGPDRLARAAARAGVPVSFVGEGEMRARIKSIYPSAAITGWLPRAGVLTQLASARALVLPSRCYETFGLAVLEAASRGVPAIVPSASAARDLVQPEVTGLWCETADVPDLERCLRRLLDPDLAKRLGRMAYRNFWRQPPTLEAHARGLEEIYRTVLTHRRPGR